MKNKIGISIIVLFIFVLLFIPNNVLGSSNGYEIESYDIDMVVNENNAFDITENIYVNFTREKHGIYRKIPLRNAINRLDGTKSNNIAKISNLQVSEEYKSSTKDGYKIIKIGDTNKTFTGRKKYTIKYTYNIGKDPLKDADELYFNLIGNEWDTTIDKVSFTINMPKSFDETKLGFSTGYKYSTDSSEIYYDVSGNKITGRFDNTLYEGQALTVRLTLPEGYFVGASNNIDYGIVIQIAISIAFVAIAYILWKKYGKDETVVETVEFYPPENLNSAEIGFLYKGYSDKKDIISLLIYLANKGYLKIEEYKDETLKVIKTKSFKITKIKNYDGDNQDEKTFFRGLFLFRNEVTKKDLYNRFYVTIEDINKNLNRKENQEKIFEKASLSKRILIIAMIIIIFLFMGGFSLIASGEIGSIITVTFLLGVGITAVYKKSSKGAIVFSIFLFVLLTFFVALPNFIYGTTYIIKYLIEIICLSVLIVFLGIIKKRTKYGTEMLGKIEGFKKFLEIAEKPKLEELVAEDPEYFYNILPYTYVLGVSDKWMKKFEDIAIKEPNWYYSNSTFSVHTFNGFMGATYSSISNAMTSKPSSSGSSSGSSGGGFSGGGSGGGGGGSW